MVNSRIVMVNSCTVSNQTTLTDIFILSEHHKWQQETGMELKSSDLSYAHLDWKKLSHYMESSEFSTAYFYDA